MTGAETEAGTTCRIEGMTRTGNLGTGALSKTKTIRITLRLVHTKGSTQICSTEGKEGTTAPAGDTTEIVGVGTATGASTSSVKLKNLTASSLTTHMRLKEKLILR